MSDSTATQASARPRIPDVTRREASALVAAVQALRELEQRASGRSYSHDADTARTQARVAEAYKSALEALTNAVIVDHVYRSPDRLNRAYARWND